MRYRLTEPAYLNDCLHKAGTEIEWDGPPGPHMVPLDDGAKRKFAQWAKANPGATIDPVSRLSLAPQTDGKATDAGDQVSLV